MSIFKITINHQDSTLITETFPEYLPNIKIKGRPRKTIRKPSNDQQKTICPSISDADLSNLLLSPTEKLTTVEKWLNDSIINAFLKVFRKNCGGFDFVDPIIARKEGQIEACNFIARL